MNLKIVAGIVVIVLIVVAVYMFTTTPPVISPTSESTTGPTTGPTTEPAVTDITTDTIEVSSVIGEEYSALILEELEKMSIEQTDFNNQIEDQISNDISQFYYD